jgi:hypothetical protein
VINLNVDHEDNFSGIQYYKSFQASDGTPYGIFLFCSGDFHLKGDGGWINWGFIGTYERNGPDVRFSSRGGKGCQ